MKDLTTDELRELVVLGDKMNAALDKATAKLEHQVVKDSLTTEVNSALLTVDNHCNDNAFVCNDLDYFIANLLNSGYYPYGVSDNPPYNNYDSPMVAYVFYDEQDEVRWVHMPKRALLHMLSEIYGRAEAKKMLNM